LGLKGGVPVKATRKELGFDLFPKEVGHRGTLLRRPPLFLF